jgi:hypothetical protein
MFVGTSLGTEFIDLSTLTHCTGIQATVFAYNKAMIRSEVEETFEVCVCVCAIGTRENFLIFVQKKEAKKKKKS